MPVPGQQGQRVTNKMKCWKYIAKSSMVTCHRRECSTKEQRILTPMPHKKERHVNIDKGALKKIQA